MTKKKVKEHKTKKYKKEITGYVCDEDGCQFKGEDHVQGHCYDTGCIAGGDMEYVDRVEKYAEQCLEETKLCAKKNRMPYVKYLESNLLCYIMNHNFILDECVLLRAENAKLRHKLQKKRRV